MTYEFRPAVRENVTLLIGLSGGTGAGKSYTAMRLARGISGDKPFAVIDTEARRALHYADEFRFDHVELRPPFRPGNYADAIKIADTAGYKAIVVDSVSHEHDGEGGILDWHDEELQRMAGDDYKKRDNYNMAAWIKPKGAHRQFVQRLLQVRAHLIICMRAEEKVEMRRGEDGKMKIQPKQSLVGLDGWVPICEKKLPFEMTCSFLLTADAPGVPKPIKLQQQHRALFPLDRPINEETGRALAAWAAGGKAATLQNPDLIKTDERNAPPSLLADAERAAAKGYEELRGFYRGLSDAETQSLAPHKSDLVTAAKQADEKMARAF